MDSLTKNPEAFFRAHCRGRNVRVAFSGGMDSLVLLVLAKQLQGGSDLTAIHVNHGVHPDAARWAIHCQQLADQLNIPFVLETLALDRLPPDPENALREARYAALARHLQAGDILLTAHHQADQAETVLLQLMRGAGPKGLSAMPLIRPFANGLHGRPLLGVSRQVIAAFAEKQGLAFLKDPSNADTRFARNFMRHTVMPLLEERWPQLAATLARSAENCADQEALLGEHLVAEQKKCRGTAPGTLSVKKLLEQPPRLQAALIRTWLPFLPSRQKLQQIVAEVLAARPDRLPCVAVRDWQVRRYRDDLYCIRRLPLHDPCQVIPWDMQAPLVIPGVGTLQPWVPACPCEVRFRQGGEKIPLPGRSGHHFLKKVLQDKGILPWLRDRVPLIFVQGELVGMVDLVN